MDENFVEKVLKNAAETAKKCTFSAENPRIFVGKAGFL